MKKEVYRFDACPSTILHYTDQVTHDTVAWQNRPLKALYPIAWMEGIVY